MRLWIGLGSLCLLLACGGLFADQERLEGMASALLASENPHVHKLFVTEAVSSGLVNPVCASDWEGLHRVGPEIRPAMLAQLLFDAPTCPRPCISADEGNALATLEPTQQMRRVLDSCSPGTLFEGELTQLAPHSSALEYLAVRMLWERAEGLVDLSELRPRLAVSLALSGHDRTDQPDGGLKVSGARTKELKGLGLESCPQPLNHRAVVSPEGTVAQVSGEPCGVEALQQLRLPKAGWRVVDVRGRASE